MIFLHCLTNWSSSNSASSPLSRVGGESARATVAGGRWDEGVGCDAWFCDGAAGMAATAAAMSRGRGEPQDAHWVAPSSLSLVHLRHDQEVGRAALGRGSSSSSSSSCSSTPETSR